MTQEEKYLQWMEEFFCEEDGETCKEWANVVGNIHDNPEMLKK